MVNFGSSSVILCIMTTNNAGLWLNGMFVFSNWFYSCCLLTVIQRIYKVLGSPLPRDQVPGASGGMQRAWSSASSVSELKHTPKGSGFKSYI